MKIIIETMCRMQTKIEIIQKMDGKNIVVVKPSLSGSCRLSDAIRFVFLF